MDTMPLPPLGAAAALRQAEIAAFCYRGGPAAPPAEAEWVNDTGEVRTTPRVPKAAREAWRRAIAAEARRDQAQATREATSTPRRPPNWSL